MEKKNRWVVIAIVAAAVAALTTVVVLVLRARAKKKAWCDQEAFDCDLDGCQCFEFDEEDIAEAAIEE
jgi:hypothetical protein